MYEMCQFVYNVQYDRERELCGTISATDAKQNFAALLDDAQRGPRGAIRRQSRDQAVLISPQEQRAAAGTGGGDFQSFQ